MQLDICVAVPASQAGNTPVASGFSFAQPLGSGRRYLPCGPAAQLGRAILNSKKKRSTVALVGLLIGASACEGKHRPWPPEGPDASSSITQDNPSTRTPEVTQPALTPDPRVSPAEVMGDGALLPQQPDTPSSLGPNTRGPLDAADAAADAAAMTPLDDCPNAGEQCDPPSGGGETPTLGPGAACGTPGVAACGSGLACKACNGGGNQCTPAAQCCGGCPGNQTCDDGTCGCTGLQIDCGGGLCIPNAADVCCPAMPACSNARPFCDSRDNICKECLQNGQCTSGPAGTTGTCTNNTCRYACNQQAGLKDCGNTRCVPASGCCSDSDCDPCSSCSAGACRPLAAGTPDRCPGAQDVCDGQQRCISQRTLGQACGQANEVCTQGGCTQGRCCPGACLQGCRADGTCACPAGATFQNGSCRSPNGSPCAVNADCIGNDCTQWLADFDLDGFGTGPTATSSVTQLIVRTCGPGVPNGGPISGQSFVLNADDCCDDNQRAHTCQECGL